MKSLGARFNAENKTWYVYNTPHFRQIFGLTKKYAVSKDVILKISDVNRRELFRLVEQLELKAYSPNTIKTYSLEFAQWLYILKELPAYDINPEQVRSYILYCVRNLKMSESHIHSRLNAIKFYYEKVLHQSLFMVEIPRPKKTVSLQKVLSVSEVKKLFAVVSNLKHQLMLRLCYGMGLRVSEIVRLKLSDIDSDRMQVLIVCAKGKHFSSNTTNLSL